MDFSVAQFFLNKELSMKGRDYIEVTTGSGLRLTWLVGGGVGLGDAVEDYWVGMFIEMVGIG